jgi:DNA-binding NarL/FixJ family response regulator
MVSEQSIAKIRVLIVDDHPVVREGLGSIIDQQPDLELAGATHNLTVARELLKSSRPDAVVVDLGLGAEDGLEFVNELATQERDIAVVVFSLHDELLFAERALTAGARAYVMKTERTETLLQAIRRAASGGYCVSERVSTRMLSVGVAAPATRPRELGRLTDREFAIFRLIGSGLTTREIASRVQLSVKTIESHRLHIKKKLGLTSANELVVQAASWVLREH